MSKYIIKKAKIEDYKDELIELSRAWVSEDCSNGMVENTISDLKEPLYVALEDGKLIGYIFGHYYKRETKLSTIDVGEPCFTIDELYVLKEYRSKGIGKMLFDSLESEIKEKANYITLSTSTKDYMKVLKFYCEIVSMDFHDAYLTKKIN